MLRLLCIAIPVAILVFHLIFEDSLLWLISLLFGLLGFLFSFINLKFRVNPFAWGLFALNLGMFIFTVVYTVLHFS
ncbi:hypothetical protein [Salinicoccus sp. YB14-2]|uniref:hypothetical protein n=1 Tax=Salinicoccus sp. YB14-2 TaxID=1572701 RepID=UPI00068ADB6D|nr:hypothetical protein [Salinicoccus sp. YB14-2]